MTKATKASGRMRILDIKLADNTARSLMVINLVLLISALILYMGSPSRLILGTLGFLERIRS